MAKCICATKPVIVGGRGAAWMSTCKSSKFPWLMLPPAIDTKVAYKFYSLSEKKVITKKSVKNHHRASDDDVGVVGCSYGWLVVHNKRYHNLFLYNHISCRRIDLPSIGTVPDKVVISSDTKLAIMCVKVKDTTALAFCVPGRSSTLWTDLNLNHNHTTQYKDFIYSSKHKLLFCETSLGKIESWDLTKPRSPRMVWQTSLEEYPYVCKTYWTYLVFSEQSDELFLVKRSMIQYRGGTQTTLMFHVFMIDDWMMEGGGKLRRCVEGSLNGLSLFVGEKNSFALPAAPPELLFVGAKISFALPAAPSELLPDSIYFTEHSDIRIYNNRSGTNYRIDDEHASSHSIKDTTSAVWFTPCTAAVSKPLITRPKREEDKITPWVLLPPLIREGNKMVYKLYSLADNKVVKIFNNNKTGKVKVSAKSVDIPPVEFECGDSGVRFVGSSHGWLALQDWNNNKELFLSNPFSSRRNHIKLPSIHCAKKLLFSGSPDDDEVCAMVIYNNPADTTFALAFCMPGRSTEWTPLVGPACAQQTKNTCGYQDFVYSSRHKLLFCVDFLGRMESWDLTDTASPRIEWSADMGLMNHYSSTIQSEQGLRPFIEKYLVFDDHSNQLFLVIERFWRVDPTQVGVDKSAGFDVYKIDDWELGGGGRLRYMDGSLNGLSLFVGANNGFALSAAEFPGLKPDSIYYTTTCHDFGIFNYQDGTFSSDFQCNDKFYAPSPLWFTPSSLPFLF